MPRSRDTWLRTRPDPRPQPFASLRRGGPDTCGFDSLEWGIAADRLLRFRSRSRPGGHQDGRGRAGMKGRFEPLRVPGYRKLAGSYAINRVGDVLALVALAVVVYDATGSALATTAMFLAMEFLPSLLAPVLTARVDRLPVAPVLTAIYVVEAVTFGLLALLTHNFSLPLVLALLAIDGTLAVLARALT